MSQEAWKNKPGEEEDVQMPLSMSEAAPAEDYTPPSRHKPNASTVALIVAFAVALSALYVLGLTNKPRKVSADDLARAKELDERWGRALAAISDKNKGVPKTLRETRGLVELLTRYFEGNNEIVSIANVFEGERPVVVAGPVIDGRPPEPSPQGQTDEERKAAAELAAAAREFSGLRLQMVMLGNPNVALVNDKLVQAGHKFDFLQVDEILSNSVILKFKDKRYTLSSQPNGKKP